MLNKAICVSFLLSCGISSAVVLTDTITSSDGGFGPGQREIQTSVFNDPTDPSQGGLGASWGFSSIDSENFQIENWTLGIGFSYYILPYETPISRDNPPIGPALVTNTLAPPDPPTEFSIPLGDSIFLGLEFNPVAPPEFRIYGWVELENDSGVVSAVDSATAYMPGIIVGTTTAIPEPSSSVLIGFAAITLLNVRRRSQK